MDNVVYSNGSFDVFKFKYKELFEHSPLYVGYGICRTDRPQDGMIFAHTDKDYCIKIADGYKETLTKG